MRNVATFIASVLLVACGADDAPAPKTSRYKTSTFVPGGTDATAVEPGVQFVDVTKAAGIDFVHVNGAVGDKWLPETMGSGVALLDYDSDGDLDVLFSQSRPWSDKSAGSPTLKLYRNDGAWKFTDVTKAAGLDVALYGMGASVADYDADGDPDFYLCCLGRSRLFRNDGGKFVEVEGGPNGGTWMDGKTERSSWSTGAVWFDSEGDGDLDLFVINYVKWTSAMDVPATTTGDEKEYSRPQLYEGNHAVLYLQQDDGSFVDATKGSGLAGKVPGKSLAICMEDFNQDGRMDLFVANDTVQNFLFINQGDNKYEEVGVAAGIGYDDSGVARAAMGIDSVDFANSGEISILIGNFSEEPVSFFTSTGNGAKKGPNKGTVLFRDDAARARIGQPTLLPLSFGLVLRDFDLDGYCDFAIANGHIMPSINKLKAELQYRQSPQLFRNMKGKRFRDVSIDAGRPFQDRFVGRGLAAGDLDGDGDLDLVFTCNGDRPRILRNDLTTKNRSLQIRLVQPGTKNLDALGAVVRAETAAGVQRRMVRTGGSYQSQGGFTLTFGLGIEGKAKVTVTWPDGSTVGPLEMGAGRQVVTRK